jgi:hypothetical protein
MPPPLRGRAESLLLLLLRMLLLSAAVVPQWVLLGKL